MTEIFKPGAHVPDNQKVCIVGEEMFAVVFQRPSSAGASLLQGVDKQGKYTLEVIALTTALPESYELKTLRNLFIK